MKIIRLLLQLNDGRDKVLKVIQYLLKILDWKLSWKNKKINQRLKNTISQLSLSRRLVRFFHFLEPLHSLESANHKDFSSCLSILNNSITLVQDCIDDVICLSKIKSIDESYASTLSTWSDIMWFVTIHLDLIENVIQARKQKSILISIKNEELSLLDSKLDHFYRLDQAKEKLFMINVGILKLCFDYSFCMFDVFGLKRFGFDENLTQVVPAFGSGLLSSFKLIKKI